MLLVAVVLFLESDRAVLDDHQASKTHVIHEGINGHERSVDFGREVERSTWKNLPHPRTVTDLGSSVRQDFIFLPSDYGSIRWIRRVQSGQCERADLTWVNIRYSGGPLCCAYKKRAQPSDKKAPGDVHCEVLGMSKEILTE